MRALDVISGISRPHAAVHACCADPGACALLGEVCAALRAAGVGGTLYTEGWAAGAGLPGAVPFDDAALARAAAPGDLLLAGARVEYPRTRHILALGRSLGLTTALAFDHWKNFTAHFLGREGCVVPDYLLMPDDTARALLMERFAAEPRLARFAPDRVLVLGHPALERSVAAIAARTPGQSRALLASHGLGHGPVAGLFLDPVALDDGYGYDTASVLGFVAAWMAGNRPGMAVLVKPHPRQTDFQPEDLAPFSARGIRAAAATGPFEPLAAAVSEVWGMTSLVLVAAHKAGRPIVSFQPGRTALGREQSNPYIEPWVIT